VDYPSRKVQFATTEDGVDIACWEIGEGKLVIMFNQYSISNAELECCVF
jgi:hypothetical protein